MSNQHFLTFNTSISDFPIFHQFNNENSHTQNGSIHEFFVLSGDMSGIQDFIFNIATDPKVARSLKGRCK
ncbi:MAG: hypothetical protein SFU91_11560 [Chloroherpetonaceae bacterium]|nr:hypothetical protein [Chloroherpetonaceae bacterium]